MFRPLTTLLKNGLLPFLLAVGLLGGFVAEATACAGELTVEYPAGAEESDSDSGTKGSETGPDACQHGHSHHGQAISAQVRSADVPFTSVIISQLREVKLSSDPPGTPDRPPRI